MSAYTVKIEDKDTPLIRNIFIENDNIGIYSWYGESYIEIGIDNHGVGANLNKEKFLELYEMMTVLKKYIDEK